MRRFYPTVVEEATAIILDLNFANGILEPINTVRTRVFSWYNNTDVTDVEMIAASALMGSYRRDMTYEDMVDAKNWWFPCNPYEEIFGEVI